MLMGLHQVGDKPWRAYKLCKGETVVVREIGSRYIEIYKNLGTRRGRSAFKEGDERGRLILPEEGAGKGRVRGELTTGLDRRVQM